MGRSRAVTHATDDDAGHRSKRRRVASTGETSENVASGPGTSEGKKASYHCNYCNRDISGKIRIKCTKCPDFDLCVECFSVGVEITPHKSNHPYRVMDNLSFPLICSDWNADEEILLLEGIEMYGMGNWAEIAEHVGTKSKVQCIDHYMTAYINSSCYPLPDMSRVNGKNRKELLAMAARMQGEGKKGLSGVGDLTPKEESPFSPSRVKAEDLSGEPLAGRSPSSIISGVSKKASTMGQFKDRAQGCKLDGLTSAEDIHVDRSVGIKRPKHSGDEGPSMTELSGYNAKRQEFDPEYDNDAEQSLTEMEFKENDTEAERELKLRVLRIYLSRLDERKRRKDFILERNLLTPHPMEKELSSEDREVFQRFKVFMRFQSQEEHENLLKNIIEERKIRRRIEELKESRAAGCRTLAESKMFTEQKRKKEMELSAEKARESGQTVVKGTESGGRVNSTRPFDEWDVTGLPGAELLSEAERLLCCQNRLLPSHYLKMQEILVQEIFKGSLVNRSDAHRLFKVDPSKVDRVYKTIIKKLGMHDGLIDA